MRMTWTYLYATPLEEMASILGNDPIYKATSLKEMRRGGSRVKK